MGKSGSREANPNWRGGRSLASSGYVLVRVGLGHHLADVRGYAYEHRLVAEAKLGRRLRPGEQVHHVDGNKRNNTPDNIEVVESIAHHRYLHRVKASAKRRPDEDNPVVSCACGCGAPIRKYDRSNRPRMYVSGHNLAICKHGMASLAPSQILSAKGR